MQEKGGLVKKILKNVHMVCVWILSISFQREHQRVFLWHAYSIYCIQSQALNLGDSRHGLTIRPLSSLSIQVSPDSIMPYSRMLYISEIFFVFGHSHCRTLFFWPMGRQAKMGGMSNACPLTITIQYQVSFTKIYNFSKVVKVFQLSNINHTKFRDG